MFAVLVRLRHGHGAYLRERHAALEAAGGAQRGAFVIVQLAQPPRHDAAENGVHRRHHLRPRAEVVAEEDAPRHALGRGGVGIAEVFFQEDRGVGQAEAVDGLLHVAHHEEIAPLAGDGADDEVLHAGDVLVLVHHHAVEAARYLARGARGAAIGVSQQAGGHVLQVRVVHQRAAALFRRVAPVEVQQQREQRAHGPRRARQVAQQLGAVLGEEARQLAGGFFAALAPGLDEKGLFVLRRALEAADAREGHGQAGSRLVPAELALRGEAAQALRRVGEAGDIGLFQPLVAGAALYQRVHLPGPVEGRVLRRAHQLRAPGRVQRVRRQFGEQPGLPARPVLGPRVALQLVVEPQDELRQAAVVAPGAHGVRQGEEIRLRALIALLQRALERAGAQLGCAVLVGDGEIGRYARLVGEFAQHRGAEAVDGADLRALYQRRLPAQPL